MTDLAHFTSSDPEWNRQYEIAWDQIEAGVRAEYNGLADDIPFCRSFVGDRALMWLFERFEPGEVIIACGIEMVTIILGPDTCREVGARESLDALSLTVRAAHQHLVTVEGDAKWRAMLPPDAANIAVVELRRLIARDEVAE